MLIAQVTTVSSILSVKYTRSKWVILQINIVAENAHYCGRILCFDEVKCGYKCVDHGVWGDLEKKC